MNFSRSLFGVYHPLHKACLLAGDIVAVALAFYVAAKVRLSAPPQYESIEYLGINLIVVFTLFIGGAYSSSGIGGAPKLPLKTFFTVLASSVPAVFFIYLLGPERFTSLFGRGVFPFAILLLAVLSVASRYLINHRFMNNGRKQRVLLLGSEKNRGILSAYLDHLIRLDIDTFSSIASTKLPLNSYAAIVVLPDHDPDSQEQQSLVDLRLSGTPVFSFSDFIESHLFLIPVQEINNDWFLKSEGFAMLHSPVATRIKRGIDILAAFFLAVVTLPITIPTALAIKLTSRGPVFFTQTRVGLQGQEFRLRKFRTMIVDAEADGAQWASDNDPRVTTVGRFLRTTRIDELPQCLNILSGEMSIIGPRPERPEFTQSLREDIPYYELRHIIKPGLSGWAQVMYPYGASKDDALRKLQYDLFYIKNQSLVLDLNILLRTVLVTAQRGGR